MALRGERFEIDLPEALESLQRSHAHENGHEQEPASEATPAAPVKDILERPFSAAKAPLPPTQKLNVKGFPEHKKRFTATRFKQRSAAGDNPLDAAAQYVAQQPADPSRPPSDESAAIDRENKQKLASMSDAEIDNERRELLGHLSPSLVDRLLKHSTAHGARGVLNASKPIGSGEVSDQAPTEKSKEKLVEPGSQKSVRFENDPKPVQAPVKVAAGADADGTGQIVYNDASTTQPSLHFPRPEQPPSLDPSSPSFLGDLHDKYFASLPADPSKLEWMRHPVSDPTYNANSSTVQIADLRFNFSGALITPRQAEMISVTEGLHHHGDAPSSAGYTLPELARLARSAVASQRCIAYQTLGRVMYRLGIGEFGTFEDQIPEGLWMVLRDGAVIETLQQEVERKVGHTSANSYATEALWLWQKGGGHRLTAT